MWNRDVPPESEAARQPQTSAPATPGHPPGERRMVAWVGKSVVFRGDLTSLEDLTIDGRVEGTIELRDYTLTVGPDAHIEAGITAKTVTVLGTVNGTIELIQRLQGEVVSLAFLVELDFLKGRDRLAGHRVTSVIQY